MHTVFKNYSASLVNVLRFSIITVAFTRTGELVFKVFKDSFIHFIQFLKLFALALFRVVNDYTCVDYPE
eukprot:GSMAST32.ASY1.ANO1.165.1 assembled CDS